MDRLPFLPSFVLAAELASPRPIVALSVRGTPSSEPLARLGVPVVIVGEAGTSSPEVPWLRGRPDATPLGSGSVGAVLCTDLFMATPDRQASLLREARRLCGDEGVLVVAVAASDEPTLLSAPDPMAVDAAELQRLLRAHFPHIALLAQLPLLGYALRRLAYDDDDTPLTMHETFLTEPDDSMGLVAVCGARYRRLDVSHLVRVPFRPFDQRVRARLEELQDLYHSTRAEGARARESAQLAIAALERLRPDAERAGDALRAAAEQASRLRLLEPELERLRAEHEATRVSRAAAEAELRIFQGRAAEAEAQSTTASAAVERLSQLRDEVMGDRARLTRELQEVRDHAAELRRTLDEREEQLALLRSERDAAGVTRGELTRQQSELDRALQLARVAAQEADHRERGTAATVDVLRQRQGELERDGERQRVELATASDRAARLEEDLRRGETALAQVREDGRTELARRDAEIRRLGRRVAEVETEARVAMAAGRDEAEDVRMALGLEVQTREEVSAQLARVQEEREVLRVQLREANRATADLNTRLEATDEKTQKEARRQAELLLERDREAEDLRAERTFLELELQRLTTGSSRDLDEARAKVTALERMVAGHEDERIKIRAATQRANERVVELEAAVEESAKDAAASREELASLRSVLDESVHESERLRRDGEQIRPLMEKMVKADAETKRELDRLRTAASDARAEAHRHGAALVEAEERAERAERARDEDTDRETLDSQVTHLHSEMEIARLEAKRANERIGELTREVERLRKELTGKPGKP